MFKFAKIFCLVPVVCHLFPAMAVDFPLSKYGQIQNVQSYSSNPFYSVDSPYNQRMPVPVYAQGTDLNAGDCQNVLAGLVAQQCASRNNCAGTRISDIRPVIMMQLANMPGYNYASACAGFLDGAFNEYKKTANNLGANPFPAAFPTGGGTSQPSSYLVMENPFEKAPDQDWEKEQKARQNELRALQRQNGSDDVELVATQMPTTFADLSFTERMEAKAEGYAPWKDAKAYIPIKVETDRERYARESEEATAKRETAEERKKLMELEDPCGWCKMYSSECYKSYSEQLADLNKNSKEIACAANAKKYKIWSVKSDASCGWKLQGPDESGATELTLEESDCKSATPILPIRPIGNQACAYYDGSTVASGSSRDCKPEIGGKKQCTNGKWSKCCFTATSGNTYCNSDGTQ